MRHLQESHTRFNEVFQDPRIIPMETEVTGSDLIEQTGDAQRVILVNAPLGPDNYKIMIALAVTLKRNGFEQVEARVYEVTSVVVFQRTRS